MFMKNQRKITGAMRLLTMSSLLAISISVLTGCADEKNSAGSTGEIKAGENLVIPVNELSESIDFYSFEIDGIEMEVLAAKDSDGTIRTAFNTCQVCNGSRQAYFEKSGDYVMCQNCGNQFSISDVGVLSGGCNPYPILVDQRTDTEDSVQLSYDFLSENKLLFVRWKNN